MSIATVSRVLRGGVRVAPATRERVLAAARELGWHPNRFAVALASAATGTVGVVFPDLDGTYFSEILRGFEQEAVARDDSVLVLATHGRPTAEQMVVDHTPHVDGLVVMDRTISDGAVRRLAERGTPLVLLARPPVADIPAVRSDNRAPAVELTAHLLAHGHTRLAFLGDPDAAPDLSERWEGFTQAHRRAGLRPPAKPVLTGFQQDDGHAAALGLLDGRAAPTAIVCGTDELALGVYAAARDLGVAIPGRLAVTGWDDIPAARAVNPPLTTVGQPTRQLGARAGALLYARIGGEAGASETLPAAPVIRRSCGC